MPINDLPTELLALIFSFVCTIDFWDYRPFSTKISLRRRHPALGGGSLFREPFVIATVCREWRSISLSTCSLWSTIMVAGSANMEMARKARVQDEESVSDLNEDDLDRDEAPDDSEVLRIALERSGQRPLQLWTECVHATPWSPIFTAMLRQVCGRIEQLYLFGDSDPFHVPDAPNVVFDRLSAVRMLLRRQDKGIIQSKLPWLSTATNVRLFILEDLLSEGFAPDFWNHLPVESIESLLFSLKYWDLAQAISTFPTFQNIRSSTLKLEYFGYEEPLMAWKPPRNLHHFVVNVSCMAKDCVHFPNFDSELQVCRCFENLLPTLTLPGLKSLRLEGDSDYGEVCWAPVQFSQFIARSALEKSLTSLTLHNISGLDDYELVKVFQCFPLLTRLTILEFDDMPIISTPMLIKLADSSFSLLSHLRFFDFYIDGTIEGIEALVGLVEARSRPRGYLEEIVVRMKVFQSLKPKERLEAGMDRFPGTRHSIKPLCKQWNDDRNMSFSQLFDHYGLIYYSVVTILVGTFECWGRRIGISDFSRYLRDCDITKIVASASYGVVDKISLLCECKIEGNTRQLGTICACCINPLIHIPITMGNVGVLQNTNSITSALNPVKAQLVDVEMCSKYTRL
ncbi:hypothetical protein C8J56DRAFT_884679 [Mycena floridula]|nr:hypothetical protein C8J56DRAFT_884679 [Mycena floridula]